MIRSFLNGTNEWRALGDAPSANAFLDAEAGLMLQWRDNNDRPLTLDRAEARTESAGATFSALDLRSSGTIAYAETFSALPLEVRATTGQTQTSARFTPTAGSFNTQVFKPGPFLSAVVPVFQPVTPRAVAPGMFITLWGTLAPVTEAASGQPYPTTVGQTQVLLSDRPLPLHYVSPTQINALLPDNISGLIKLTGALITRDAPTRRGDYITVYVTGLGLADPGQAGLLWSRQQPTVQIGNVECIVGFAGRHSVYAGLDQINCQIPGSAGTGDLNLTVKCKETNNNMGCGGGARFPVEPESNKSGRMVHCVKFEREMPGLDEVPFEGHPLGQKIYESVSKEAWKMWLERMKMIMNEYRLNLGTQEAQEFLLKQMDDFFFGEGAALPPGYVPPRAKA
jgi:Fe-S cluster biosynthesis and repair protein YggX